MTSPSNPLVNPINGFNPIQYSQTIFNPNITPEMAKSSCLNQNVECNEKINENTNMQNVDLNNNNNIDFNKTSNDNNNIFNDLNKQQSTLMSQNLTNYDNKMTNKLEKTNNSFDVHSLNPYINTNDFNSNSSNIPRPVLTDFSSFGM